MILSFSPLFRIIIIATFFWTLGINYTSAISPTYSSVQAEAIEKPTTISSTEPTLTQLETLVSTLEDPNARALLLEQLKGLIAASKVQQSSALSINKTVFTKFLSKISEVTTRVSKSFIFIENLPQTLDHIVMQVENPALREWWKALLGKIAMILLAGIGAELAAKFIIRRTYSWSVLSNISDSNFEKNSFKRLLLSTRRASFEIIPPFVFAVSAYLCMQLVDPSFRTRLVALAFINANVALRAVMVIARILLSPYNAQLRVFALRDRAAGYLYRWTYRLVSVAIYGMVMINAVDLLNIPTAIGDLVERILALSETIMLTILALQNRHTVASWLRGCPPIANEASGFTRMINRFRAHLADVWHIFGIIYLIVMYTIWALDIPDGVFSLIKRTILTVLISLAAWFISFLIRLGTSLLSRWKAIELFPGLKARSSFYISTLKLILRYALVIFVILTLLEVWGPSSLHIASSYFVQTFIISTSSIISTIIIAVILWELFSYKVECYLATVRDSADKSYPRHSSRALTLLPLIRNIVGILLMCFIGLTTLSQIGINIAPLLAGAGVVGLAVGFGAQTLVKDVITGLFILLEDTINVGDVITINSNHSGQVEAISIRTLRLRDSDGSLQTIPFSTVEAVRNHTKNYGRAIIRLAASYDSDIDQITCLLAEIDNELQKDPKFAALILEPLEIWGVEKLGEFAITVSGVSKTLAGKHLVVQREFNRRIIKRFSEAGIVLAQIPQLITAMSQTSNQHMSQTETKKSYA